MVYECKRGSPTNKYISVIRKQKYNLLQHNVVKMSQNGIFFFLFLELRTFSLQMGKNKLFAIGNMTQYGSSKWAQNSEFT